MTLADAGKTRQYLMYAIGEIALVVIGILIALQVNNWNERRKQKEIENEVLQEIRNDLEETLYEDLNEDLESHLRMLWSAHIVKNALVNKKPYHDSLERHLLRSFGDTRTYYKAGGYQSMLSRGIEIITNDTLRTEITDLYQLGFPRLSESANEYDNRKEMWPFERQYFRLNPEIKSSRDPILSLPDSIDYYRPQLISYPVLLEDNQFIMEMQNSMSYRQRKIRRCIHTRDQIEAVLQMIENELK